MSFYSSNISTESIANTSTVSMHSVELPRANEESEEDEEDGQLEQPCGRRGVKNVVREISQEFNDKASFDAWFTQIKDQWKL